MKADQRLSKSDIPLNRWKGIYAYRDVFLAEFHEAMDTGDTRKAAIKLGHEAAAKKAPNVGRCVALRRGKSVSVPAMSVDEEIGRATLNLVNAHLPKQRPADSKNGKTSLAESCPQKRTSAVGQYKDIAAEQDLIPPDDILCPLIGVTSGALSNARAVLRKEGYEFKGIAWPGSRHQAWRVTAHPPKPKPEPIHEPSPLGPIERIETMLWEIHRSLESMSEQVDELHRAWQ